MVKDNPSPPQSQSESQGHLPPGAIGHYLHWAHVFMQRYYLQRWNRDIREPKKEERESITEHTIYQALEQFDGRIAAVETIPDEGEKRKALGEIVFDRQSKIIDSIISAMMFVRTVVQYDSDLPVGNSDPDTSKAEDKALNKANMEHLEHGLNASLASLGFAYGTLRRGNGEPKISGYRSPGPGSLRGQFQRNLSLQMADHMLASGHTDNRKQWLHDEAGPFMYAVISKGVSSYVGGFHEGRRSCQPSATRAPAGQREHGR